MPSLSFPAGVVEPFLEEEMNEKRISRALLPFQHSLPLLQYRLSRCIQEIELLVVQPPQEPRSSPSLPIPTKYSPAASLSFSRPFCLLLRRLGVLLRQARFLLDRIVPRLSFSVMDTSSAADEGKETRCGEWRTEGCPVMQSPDEGEGREGVGKQPLAECLSASSPSVPVGAEHYALHSRSASPDPTPDRLSALPPTPLAPHLSRALPYIANETKGSETRAPVEGHQQMGSEEEARRTSSSGEEEDPAKKRDENHRQRIDHHRTAGGVAPEVWRSPLTSSWQDDAMEEVDKDGYDSTSTFHSFPHTMVPFRLDILLHQLVSDVVRGYAILEAPLRGLLPLHPTAWTPSSSSSSSSFSMPFPLPMGSVGAVGSTHLLPTVPFPPLAPHSALLAPSSSAVLVGDASFAADARRPSEKTKNGRTQKDFCSTPGMTTAAVLPTETHTHPPPIHSSRKSEGKAKEWCDRCASSLLFLLPPSPPFTERNPHDRTESADDSGSHTTPPPPRMEERRRSDHPFLNVQVLRIHHRNEEEEQEGWYRTAPFPKHNGKGEAMEYGGYHEEEIAAEEWEVTGVVGAEQMTTTSVEEEEDASRRNENGAATVSSFSPSSHSHDLFPQQTSVADERSGLRERRRQKNASQEEAGGPPLTFPLLPPRRNEHVTTKGKSTRRKGNGGENGGNETGMVSSEEDEVNVVVSQVHSLVKEMKQQALQMNDWVRGEDRDALGKNEALLTEGVHQGEENMKSLSKLSDVHGSGGKSTGRPAPSFLRGVPYGEQIWAQMILPLLDLIKQILLLCLIIVLTLTTLWIVFTRGKPSRYSPILPFSDATESSFHPLETPAPQGKRVTHTASSTSPLPATVTTSTENTSMTLARAAIPAKNRTNTSSGRKTVTRTASTTTPHSTKASTKPTARKKASGGAPTSAYSTGTAAIHSSTPHSLPLD